NAPLLHPKMLLRAAEIARFVERLTARDGVLCERSTRESRRRWTRRNSRGREVEVDVLWDRFAGAIALRPGYPSRDEDHGGPDHDRSGARDARGTRGGNVFVPACDAALRHELEHRHVHAC